MNEPRDPAFTAEPAPGSDETLSAYLLGELDEAETAAFERRLSDEPALRARLDALAAALTALGGVDEVAEPEGFAERLDARLNAEFAIPSLDARRRRQRWSAVLTAAASVTVLAVAGAQVLTGSNDLGVGGQESMEMAQEESAGGTAQDFKDTAAEAEMYMESDVAPPTDETQQHRTTADQDGSSGAGAGMAANDTAAAPLPDQASAAQDGPLILDEGAQLDTDEQLRQRFTGAPESERLRGMRRDEAGENAVRHAEIVRAAEPFSGGVRPDACLDEVGAGADARIVARVELLRWQGGEALAYVIGLPGPGSGQVDRWELWLVSPRGCDTRRFLTWQ